MAQIKFCNEDHKLFIWAFVSKGSVVSCDIFYFSLTVWKQNVQNQGYKLLPGEVINMSKTLFRQRPHLLQCDKESPRENYEHFFFFIYNYCGILHTLSITLARYQKQCSTEIYKIRSYMKFSQRALQIFLYLSDQSNSFKKFCAKKSSLKWIFCL